MDPGARPPHGVVPPKKGMEPAVLIAIIAGALGIGLPVVVAIIGVLAAIAIPNFLRYSLRAKHAEAKTTLRAIASGENAYFAEHDRYLPVPETTREIPGRDGADAAPSRALEALGVALPPRPRFQYEVEVGDGGAVIVARGDCDGDGTPAEYRLVLRDGRAGELEELSPGEF